MARDTSPAYSAPADETGERTAENQEGTTVTEAQADQTDAQNTEQVDQTATADQATDADVKDAKAVSTEQTSATEEAAARQAEEDAKALHEARGEEGLGYVTREANPEVGGESFPSFAPKKQ